MKKRVAIDAEKLHLWQCCGNWLAPGISLCPTCNRPRTDHCDSRRSNSEPKCGQSNALDAKSEVAEALPESARRFIVTIERHSSGVLDDDNFSGGAKQLRDAIAELLGKKGDSEADGIEFRYIQVKSKIKKTVVKIKIAE